MSELLQKLNAFTRREHTEDEVYIFDVILCDNEIDRDNECFTLEALESLKSLFIGKTGIFDHNPKGINQTARIFETEIIVNPQKKTKTGEDYACLKGTAYMVRTESNGDLIKEIDAGIKKEVSISCKASKSICSLCGTNTAERECRHIAGKSYSGKTCHRILDGITDAYEWSFVAVPAQINAGVTKHFGGTEAAVLSEELAARDRLIAEYTEELRADVIRLSFFQSEAPFSTVLENLVEKSSLDELILLKKSLMSKCPTGKAECQLAEKLNDNLDSFKI